MRSASAVAKSSRKPLTPRRKTAAHDVFATRSRVHVCMLGPHKNILTLCYPAAKFSPRETPSRTNQACNRTPGERKTQSIGRCSTRRNILCNLDTFHAKTAVPWCCVDNAAASAASRRTREGSEGLSAFAQREDQGYSRESIPACWHDRRLPCLLHEPLWGARRRFQPPPAMSEPQTNAESGGVQLPQAPHHAAGKSRLSTYRRASSRGLRLSTSNLQKTALRETGREQLQPRQRISVCLRRFLVGAVLLEQAPGTGQDDEGGSGSDHVSTSPGDPLRGVCLRSGRCRAASSISLDGLPELSRGVFMFLS